jgi:hypothetical protein
MGRKKTNHTHQINAKFSEAEYDKVQSVNTKFFHGTLNNSDLARFLIGYALDKLESAKVELRTVVLVDGVPVAPGPEA